MRIRCAEWVFLESSWTQRLHFIWIIGPTGGHLIARVGPPDRNLLRQLDPPNRNLLRRLDPPIATYPDTWNPQTHLTPTFCPAPSTHLPSSVFRYAPVCPFLPHFQHLLLAISFNV